MELNSGLGRYSMEYNGEAITKVRARELYNEADQKVLNTAFINTEIKNAEKHIQRADAVTGKLTERANRNAEELDDCQHLADRMSERAERIQRIIADVENANKTDGTQADSNP